jgi:glycosyltransferase involved in cell wall biosynthesis
MRIYWYWPHPHRSASPLCLAVMQPGDELTVHAFAARDEESIDPIPQYEVVRNLADPAAFGKGSLGRAIRPVGLALSRSRSRAHLVRRGFDVAHIGNLAYATDWLDLARLRKRVALVSDVHDVRPHRRTLPVGVETRLLRQTYRNAGHLVVLHRVLKEQMVSELGVDADHVHVVPHVLDASASRDDSVVRGERPMILFFGTLRNNKGLDVLADALVALDARLDADVVIAGSGDEHTTNELRNRLGRLQHVQLEFGRVSPERKRTLFSQASWVVLPYTSFHSQSGVLADAYAYRVPLIVSDVGAIGTTVRDDGTGCVVPPRDHAALADALIAAAAAPPDKFALALGDAAHRYDVSVVGPTLRAIYELAAQERSA